MFFLILWPIFTHCGSHVLQLCRVGGVGRLDRPQRVALRQLAQRRKMHITRKPPRPKHTFTFLIYVFENFSKYELSA